MPDSASELARRLARDAEAVCRHYLSSGRREGRYWLVGEEERHRIGRLESTGAIDRAEAEIGEDVIAEAHARYAAERDAALPPGHNGPRPSGGVGGTRRGIKCFHAHWAWHLAGGDDPVGRWIERELGDAGD